MRALALALASQVLALTLVYGSTLRPRRLPPFSPFGEAAVGPVANSGILLVLVVAAGLVLVLMVRYRGPTFLRLFVVGTMSIAGFLLSLLLLPSAVEISGVRVNGIGSLLLALTVPVGGAVAMSPRAPRGLATTITVILAAEAGAYLALILNPPTLLIAPLLFALYDIFAVLRGPLHWLTRHDALTQLAPLVARSGDLTLGLGDLGFYALLPAAALLLTPAPIVLVTLAVTNLGLTVTILGLAYRQALPGLPVPILLGTAVVTLAWLGL